MRQVRTPFSVPFARILSVLLMAALSTLAGVSVGAQQANEPGPQAAAETVDGGIIEEIVVKVNGVAILHSEYEAQWGDRLASIRSQLPEQEILAQWHELRLTILASMIEQLMLEQRAEEIGIIANANEIDRTVTRVREQNGLLSDDMWEQALAQSGLTEAVFRDQIAKNIVAQRLIFSEIQRQVVVQEREVASYYEENVGDFTTPAQVAFQQLIFTFSTDKEADRTKAEAALAELSGGVSLSAVGSKYNAITQGADEVSYIELVDLREEIAATINELTPLTYSDIVETPFGYVILQLMDRKEETVMLLEEANAEIRAILEERKMQERMGEYTNELRDRAFLEIFSDEFEDIESIWAEPEGGTTDPSNRRR